MKSILLVEDEPLVVAYITAITKSLGYRVQAAKDGAEALWMYDLDPAIDALVTDVRMPGMDGFELSRTLRAKRPDLPILIISAYFTTHPVEARNVLDSPGIHFLAKPFSRDQLIAGFGLLFT